MPSPPGRPPKSAAAKKAAGTHRKDRPTEADAPPPPDAAKIQAPSGLSRELVAEWARLIADLRAVGIVSNTDIDRLKMAFTCKANAAEIQKSLNLALRAHDATEISKLQSAHASAIKTADSIIAAVERSVKLRPRAKSDGETWED